MVNHSQSVPSDPIEAEKKGNGKVGIVSLGCPKALVDSERIISRLRAEGYEVAPDYQNADLVLVNTCGFLKTAREESLDAIGEAIAENGQVIVTGCLGPEEGLIRQHHPEVLAVSGPHQYETVMQHVHEALPPTQDAFDSLVPPQGVRLTPRHYAYLKISEGCNNSCSFCIIPGIRGKLASRPAANVINEAEKLVGAGVRELLVISQDTSAYGVDTKYEISCTGEKEIETRLHPLAEELGKLGAWVRLHYIYPYPSVDKIVELMAEDNGLLPYLDIPFQHASPNVLKSMRRPAHQEKTLERILNWKKVCPDLGVRSTFIVGYPGETDKDFEFLLDWLKEARLARLGCFTFENIEGAPASDLPDQVPQEVKHERWDRLMEVQQEISDQLMQEQIGQIKEVIIDAVDEEGAIARSHWDAPEIDGQVFIDEPGDLQVGDIIKVKVDDAAEYDLWGKEVKLSQTA